MLDPNVAAELTSEAPQVDEGSPKQRPLTMEQFDALLSLLSTDDEYRDLFQRDLTAAFLRLPGQPEPPKVATPGACLWPRELASKEVLAASRQRILNDWLGFGTLIPKILEA